MKPAFVILMLLVSFGISKAQPACNGVLGAPILNFDFGQGNNTDTWFSPLATYAPGLSTNTIFQSSGSLPAANTSGLVKNSSVFGPAPYWLASNDHTGNTNGLFFGLNMPDNIGDTVVEYVMNDLCPNTTLQFSIYLLNLMSPNHPSVISGAFIQYPNMIMRIVDLSNNVLGTYTTGNVPTDGVWHQYAFLFSNGNNSTVKLQLVNNTPGSDAGNDVALDDITVRPCVPVAHISPKLDTTFCKTTSQTFSANITSGVYAPPMYQWQYSTNLGQTWINSGSLTSSATFNFNFSAANAPAEYWIRYLVSPAGVSNGANCHAVSDTAMVRIDSIAPHFLHPSDTTLCPNTSIRLPVGNLDAASYLWSTGATSDTLLVNTSGTYWLKIRSEHGCTATDTMQVTIPVTPLQVDFSYILAKACTDDTVHFTNLSDPGRYRWSFGDVIQPDDTTTNPTHIYASQGAYVVRLTFRNNAGCVDSALKVIDTRHVIDAAFIQSADSVCQTNGTQVQFTDASTGSITGFHWMFGDGTGSTAQNPSHLFTQAGYKTIMLVVNDAIPCYDTATGVIRVDSLPDLRFTENKHNICEGDAVVFEPSYANASNALSWNFGDGNSWSASGATAHRYDNAGIYPTAVTGYFGSCGSLTAADSVVVNTFPNVDLGPDSTICLDAPSIRIQDNNNQNDATVTWLWNTGATTPFIDVVHPGIYTLTATRNGCATSEKVEINKDCYTDIPNVFTPNGDGINDYFYPRQLLSKGLAGFNMSIFNRWGQKIFETTNTNGRGWDGTFNGKEQPIGVFIYKITAVMKNGRTETYTGNVTLMR